MRDIIKVMRVFQARVPDSTCNQLEAFLVVAREPGLRVGEVNRRLGVGTSSTCRAISSLLERARGREGYGLLLKVPDPEDGRVQRLYLTKAGTKLLAAMEAGDA